MAPCVGGPVKLEQTEITPTQATDALYGFRSDPAFFGLDDNGNDADEKEENQ